MKQEVSYNGLKFEPYLTKEQIAKRVAELAKDIERDCAGKCPLFVCVLNGAFTFAADLFRAVDIDAEISFIRLKSYDGTDSTGKVKHYCKKWAEDTGRPLVFIKGAKHFSNGDNPRQVNSEIEKFINELNRT